MTLQLTPGSGAGLPRSRLKTGHSRIANSSTRPRLWLRATRKWASAPGTSWSFSYRRAVRSSPPFSLPSGSEQPLARFSRALEVWPSTTWWTCDAGSW